MASTAAPLVVTGSCPLHLDHRLRLPHLRACRQNPQGPGTRARWQVDSSRTGQHGQEPDGTRPMGPQGRQDG